MVEPAGYFRGRRLAPDSLTASRPAIGLVAFALLLAGQATAAGWLYLVGYLTDVADGYLARRLGVASDAGTRLDGWCDVAFHGLIGAGLIIRAALDGVWWIVVALVAMQLIGRVLPRWIGIHTLLGKVVGGLNRVIIVVCFLALIPPGPQRTMLAATTAALLAATYLYEGRVTLWEHRTGERTMR
jgi:phosphatidylglycerophosphate synthase